MPGKVLGRVRLAVQYSLYTQQTRAGPLLLSPGATEFLKSQYRLVGKSDSTTRPGRNVHPSESKSYHDDDQWYGILDVELLSKLTTLKSDMQTVYVRGQASAIASITHRGLNLFS